MITIKQDKLFTRFINSLFGEISYKNLFLLLLSLADDKSYLKYYVIFENSIFLWSQHFHIFDIFQCSSADPFFFIVRKIFIGHPSSMWRRDDPDSAGILSVKTSGTSEENQAFLVNIYSVSRALSISVRPLRNFSFDATQKPKQS